MRAAFVPEPGRVEVGEFDVPEPVEGQVLVRMHVASICGSDVHMVFDGLHDPSRLGRPGWPGHEGAGVVVATRSPAIAEGTPVLTVPLGRDGGCFAEFQVVDASQVVALAPGADLRRLLLAQQLGTTLYGMAKFVPAGSPPPRTAVVIGAGSAGLFFTQLLRTLGCPEVLVSDLDGRRLAIATRLGASRVVDATTESVVDVARELTDGAGADLVVEAAGYDRCRADAVEAARERGTVGLFGYPERTGDSPFPVERAFRRSLRMEWVNGTQREPGLRSFRDAVAAIADGTIAVEHCLEHMVGIDDAADALAAARDHGRGAAKVGFVLATGG